MSTKDSEDIISQADIDSLLSINEFIDRKGDHSLVEELKLAILDSGKLELAQWQILRDQLREIEALTPHIDLIIKLKKEL